MKVDFKGVTRELTLDAEMTLQQSVTIQEFTGLPVFAWLERLSNIGDLTGDDVAGVKPGDTPGMMRLLRKTPMYSDLAFVNYVAAAHWLMLAQAGEDPPPLDDKYSLDVLGFTLAFMTAAGEDMKAQAAAQAQAAPKAPPGRRAPSSRRTAALTSNPRVPGLPLPPTGS